MTSSPITDRDDGHARRRRAPMSGPRRWWWTAGVQVRSTIAATALQAVVIAAAGALLLVSLQSNLTRSIDDRNASNAQSIAAQVTGELLTGAGGESHDDVYAAIDAVAQRRAFVQVLGFDGRVVASSADLAGFQPLTTPATSAGEVRISRLSLPSDHDAFRVRTSGGNVAGHRFTVVVGQSLEPVEDSLTTALTVLAVGVPLLLIVVAAATFLFVGRALRPVGAIRRTVENISAHDLTDRVPVPPGSDEVAQLAGTMNAMLARLDAATLVQRQFVADASHELRGPIATLQAGADIADLMPERIGKAELVALVRNEAGRLEHLVSDLLLLARSDEGRPARTTEEVDLDDLVDAEVKRLRASTRLTVSVQLSPIRVLGHGHQLSRLLRNLTDNAARHAGQHIDIVLMRVGSQAVLEVANDGTAIPARDRDRVFDRFVRLDESRARDSGGSGLGLSIVREVALAHGGSVSVVDGSLSRRLHRRSSSGVRQESPVDGRGVRPAGVTTQFAEGTRFRVILPISLLPEAD